MPTRAAAGRAGRVRKQGRARPRMGLALAGGGPLGGIYEVGVLLALADSLDGIELNDLDVYVGVSSGSYVAAALANGISPAQMYRLFIDDGSDATLTPEVFLRPAFAEFSRRCGALPRLVARATIQYLRHPFNHGLMESFATLGAGDADRHLRQRGDRRLPGQALRGPRAHQRFPQARPQAVPRRHQPRFGRIGDVRRARTRPRLHLARDRSLVGAAGPVPARPHRRRVLRRRRAQQDAARLGRARRGHRPPAVRQPAGAVRREQGPARRPADRREAEPAADSRSCCRRRSARSSTRG